ncbi:MAG: phosphatase PAP2 family protein [Chitinophagales bacterium]
MIRLIKENRIFYLLCLLWFIIAGIYLVMYSKGAFSLALNKLHNPTADLFFRYATWLGDGIIISSVCLLLIFVKFRYAILTILISFVSAWLVSLIKKFYDEPRPSVYFKDDMLNYVDGIELYQRLSFPSGHTAAAFTLFCLFTFFAKNKNYGYLFFTLALIVAISRVYLLQHFLVDVYFGSFFGIFFATIFYYLLMRSPLFGNKKWHERGLLVKYKERG